MVRKNPLENRGPAVQPTLDKKQSLTIPETLFELQTEAEYKKLWNHILYGTKTCIRMLKGYTDLGMPGEPLESLINLRNTLNEIIERHKND